MEGIMDTHLLALILPPPPPTHTDPRVTPTFLAERNLKPAEYQVAAVKSCSSSVVTCANINHHQKA